MTTALDLTTRRGRGRPRKSSAPAQSIEQLLEASAAIFARDGYDGVSLRKLQKELGVSYTFFHHYFDSKDALWKAVVDQLAGATTTQVLAALSNIDEHHNELDALREAIAIYLRNAIEHPAIHLICLQEAISGGPRLDYIYRHYFEGAWAVIGELVCRVELSGRMKAIPAETLFFAVQSALAPLIQRPFYQKLTGKKTLPTRNIDHYIQQTTDLLFYGWCRA